MTQYDAGPGDRSDRPWDDPNKKPKPQARRRRLALPPWALLAILVAIIILLCVGLVLVVQAIRGRGENETPTPIPTPTRQSLPTSTTEPPSSIPTIAITPTNTITLPIEGPDATPTPSAIGPGTMVVVQGTLGGGLNIREQPTTSSRTVASAKEGTVLVVLDGPQEADGYVWWQVRTPEGDEGWAATDWLVLKTEP